MGFELRELHHADGCNALSFGDAAFTPLKTFLRREAKKLHQEHLARTFVLVPQGETKVLAYITTLCTHVAVEQLGQRDDVLDTFRYKDYPATKLARLAVDGSLKRQGIGSQLVDFVIGLITDHVMPYTGCWHRSTEARQQSTCVHEWRPVRCPNHTCPLDETPSPRRQSHPLRIPPTPARSN